MPFAVAKHINNADKHASDVRCLLAHKGKLYSGGDDGKIKMWSDSLKLLGTASAHNGIVYSLAASDDTLFSCSSEGTVKSWTLDLKEKDTILKDQTAELWKLVYEDNALFVGSNEGIVKLFVNNKFRSSVNVIEPVGDMVVFEDLIYVVKDFDVVIQEVYPGSKTGFGPKKVIQGRHPLCLVGDKLCFSSRTGKDILIYESTADFQFSKYAEAKNVHESVDALCTSSSFGKTWIYSGGPDKSLKQWTLAANKLQNQNTCSVEMPIICITSGTKGEVYVGGGGGDICCVDVQ